MGAGYPARRPAAAIALAIAALALMGLPNVAAGTAHASSGPPSGTPVPAASALSWSNGVEQLVFPHTDPSFTLRSVGDPRVVSTHLLTALAEVNPGGNITAIGAFESPNASWTFSNQSGATGLSVVAHGTVAVLPSQGVWESDDNLSELDGPLGNASVNVSFYLNGSNDSGANALRYSVNVSGWPWLDAANDSLGLETHMVASSGTAVRAGPALMSLEQVTVPRGAVVSTLSWAPLASVSYPNGSGFSSSVQTYRLLATDGANSSVRLLFGAVAGGYSSLEYDPWVVLHLDAFAPLPAWVIDLVAWMVIAGAASAALALAVVALRRRRAGPEESL